MAKLDIGKIVAVAIAAGASQVAADDKTKMVPAEVSAVVKAATDIAAPDLKEIQAQIDHATNNEAHWYQKRSFWSAIVQIGVIVLAPIAARYGLDGYMTPDNLDMVVSILTKGGAAWGAYLAIRAGTATKPLGS